MNVVPGGSGRLQYVGEQVDGQHRVAPAAPEVRLPGARKRQAGYGWPGACSMAGMDAVKDAPGSARS